MKKEWVRGWRSRPIEAKGSRERGDGIGGLCRGNREERYHLKLNDF